MSNELTLTNEDSADLQSSTDKQNPGEETRTASDDKSKKDADHNLPEEEKEETSVENAAAIDELVQGKKLEEKYRGGDVTDADEFAKGNY